MGSPIKAVELAGIVDDKGHLHLDEPLKAMAPGRVRVILLFPEEADITESEWLRAATLSPSFGFLREAREDIYTLDDGEPFHDQE